MPLEISKTKEGVLVSLHVVPGAKKAQFCGLYGNSLKVKVMSKPEGGKANAEVVELLSKKLSIPKSLVQIIRGLKSREKVVLLVGQSKESVLDKIDDR